MTAQRALCLNAAGAGDRLTLGTYYRVVKELGTYIVVVDDDVLGGQVLSASVWGQRR